MNNINQKPFVSFMYNNIFPHYIKINRNLYCCDQDLKLHSFYDLPAIIHKDGTKEWFNHDKRHRDDDKPALIRPSGIKMWYNHDKLHRDNNKPAIIRPDGHKEYWIYGVLMKIKYND